MRCSTNEVVVDYSESRHRYVGYSLRCFGRFAPRNEGAHGNIEAVLGVAERAGFAVDSLVHVEELRSELLSSIIPYQALLS